MVDVDLPEIDGVPALVTSFAACLASVLEIPVADLPPPPPSFDAAIHLWRSWLAGRGAGLVEIAGADRFSWPGYWLAIVAAAGGGDGAAVVMFGSPSGVLLSPQDPTLLGSAASDLAVSRGYVLSPLDPAAVGTALRARLKLRGTVEAIAIAEAATAPMRQVPLARAIAGAGLEGDRYAGKAGTFTPKARQGGRGYDLTLIEAEVLDRLSLPGDRRLGYIEARRNIVTRGIDLNALVDRRFRVGEAECVGRRLCEPCSHLERLTTPGVLRGLIHSGGLRADVVGDGLVSTGAEIETID